MRRYGAVILAAGGSSRLGEPKQLLSFAGKTLVERIVETAFLAGADPVIVVLGAAAEKCRAVLNRTNAQILENTAWQKGLASSIHLGISALPEGIDGTFILLCDQPRVSPDLLTSLIARQSPIAASFYGGVAGPPIYISRRFFAELLLLEGDSGAKSLLQKYTGEVELIDFPGGLYDVDTPIDRDQLATLETGTSSSPQMPVL